MDRKRILIADADRTMRSLVGFTLGGEEFELHFAADGEEALALALCEKPHLLILEILLPDLSGCEVCRLLKHDPTTASLKVLFLTTRTDQRCHQEALRFGADAYVTKPFSPFALLSRVRALLSVRHQSRFEQAG